MYSYRPQNTLFSQIIQTRKRSVLKYVLLIISLSLSAQQISIKADNTPLNEVVYQLIEEYNIQLSFNDKQLSKARISLEGKFINAEEAILNILKESKFDYTKENDVYIIFKRKLKKYFVDGWVCDKYSNESLPYAHVIVNGAGLLTDSEGKFLMESSFSELDIQVSYLGYYILDTTVNAGDLNFYLIPSVHGLEEITINGKKVERSMEIGELPGKIRLNQKTARKLPGNGDNAIYNFLRLQPGILAAGEQSGDLIIWGSYEGHSKVIFDGFTLYGLKNFNDNISAVNPYMTKDMIVHKGGYEAEYGGRVGGIVDITGITGDKNSPQINLNINNMTMNGMASVPVNSNSALTVAFRRTYYNLYQPEDLPILRQNSRQNVSDISIVPDYTFGDFNLKYAGQNSKFGSYQLSYYQGTDNFEYSLKQEKQQVDVVQELKESNRQKGGSIYLNRSIVGGLKSDLSITYSELNNEGSIAQNVTRISNNQQVYSRSNNSSNNVQELGLTNRYYYNIGKENQHQLKGGLGYKYHNIDLVSQENSEDQLNTNSNTGRIESFISDNYQLNEYIQLNTGIRIDKPQHIKKTYIQPRLSLKLMPSKNVNTYIAWGIYNQFISKTSILDNYGNYKYFWTIADELDVPVLNSQHFIGGFSINNTNLTFSAEGYYKNTDGITRYVNLVDENIITVFKGSSHAYGGDFLLKGKYKKHEAWISYSLSKTLEYFPYFVRPIYRYAPQDQRHEVKGSLILNFKSFSFSTNYVYGSGFLLRNKLSNLANKERYPYSRLDAALIYNVSVKNYNFEIGASVLNLLNTENIKYANFIKVPSDQLNSVNIHAEAVPFTPTIFLNLNF
jgi:hypothetical protein